MELEQQPLLVPKPPPLERRLTADRHIEDALRSQLVTRRYTLKRRLKSLGESNPYLMSNLADHLEVAQPTLSAWETGRFSPNSLAKWRAWAAALGIELEITLKAIEQ